MVPWSFWKNETRKKQDWEQSITATIWKSEGFLKTNSLIHVFLSAKSREKTQILTFIFLTATKVSQKIWDLTKSKTYKIKSSLMSKKKYFTHLMNVLLEIKGSGIQIVYILDSTFFFSGLFVLPIKRKITYWDSNSIKIFKVIEFLGVLSLK